MSTPQHPVGTRSKRVYRRRRFVFVLLCIVVVVILALIVVRPWSSRGESKVISTSTSTSTASPAAGAADSPAPTSTVGGCDSSDVTVAAITDASSYSAGQLPKLSLSLTNTGSVPCTINAGTAAQVFTITSGSVTYWTSTDCQTNASNAEVTLQPGATVTSQAPIVWDRTRSDPATCNSARLPVPAAGASYFLSTSVDGIVSKSPKQFLLIS